MSLDTQIFDQIFVISLARSVERYSYFCEKHSSLLDFEKLQKEEGVDGGIHTKSGISQVYFKRAGALLSLKNIISQSKQKGYQKILIFEDDADFRLDMVEIFNEAVADLRTVDWDFCSFGCNVLSPIEKFSNGLFRLNHSLCLQAFALNDQNGVFCEFDQIPDDIYELALKMQSSWESNDKWVQDRIILKYSSFVSRELCFLQRAGHSFIDEKYSDYNSLMINNFNKNIN